MIQQDVKTQFKSPIAVPESNIYHHGNGVYSVQSSQGIATYTVIQDTQMNTFACNCLGYANRERCKHCDAVRIIANRWLGVQPILRKRCRVCGDTFAARNVWQMTCGCKEDYGNFSE